jgi:hypothetical protein
MVEDQNGLAIELERLRGCVEKVDVEIEEKVGVMLG